MVDHNATELINGSYKQIGKNYLAQSKIRDKFLQCNKNNVQRSNTQDYCSYLKNGTIQYENDNKSFRSDKTNHGKFIANMFNNIFTPSEATLYAEMRHHSALGVVLHHSPR